MAKLLATIFTFTLSLFTTSQANDHLPSNLTNTSSHALPQIFAPASAPQNTTTLEQIRNTLSLYPLCVDGKAFPSLSLVFTPDAVANYSAPLNILQPLSGIQSSLEKSLAPVDTQHHLGTQVIELEEGHGTARAVTYFRAAHFGKGKYEGEVLYAWGQYRDVLVKMEEESGEWRVRERTLVYMAPLIGNMSVFDG